MTNGTFGTAINCMDGRVQEPVMNWVKEQFQVQYVDKINDAGPTKVILEGNEETLASIKKRVEISHHGHRSEVLVIAGHHDCAGNPVPREEQVKQIKETTELANSWGYDMKIVGLYVNDQWKVEQVTEVIQPNSAS
ncbi:carbonic anhydrase [Alkalibacillus aidingensis]|uniref:carbonic anhydrase n=1 Tax=Alkalibacillus aidingensis TaxID=2747607 RepID=UPI0016605057|nr:carbonic anhydrase [Alkalibacillus aidingensis]